MQRHPITGDALQHGQERTEAEKMACMWFGEIPSCCSLTLLLGPACFLLKYVLQTIFSGPVLSLAAKTFLAS